MLYLLASIAAQVACVVHAIRNGRNMLWIWPIILVPLVGCVAYFVVEILPGLCGNRHVRTIRAKATARLDPEREVRMARAALDVADTAANHIRLADALAAVARPAEAVPGYREALARQPLADGRTQRKLAAALFAIGEAAEALALIERIEPPIGQRERDQLQLLRARALEHLGRASEAEPLYADIVTRMPGEEARCRYAALLLAQDRRAEACSLLEEACSLLEEVERRMKLLDRTQRAADADMYRWAMATLSKLRG